MNFWGVCTEDRMHRFLIFLVIFGAIGTIIGMTRNVACGNYPLENKAYRIVEISSEKEEIRLSGIENKNIQTFQISKVCLRNYSPKAIVLIVGKTFDDCTWLKE